MPDSPDITRLKTSWTKYDCVQVIEIIGENDLDSYIKREKSIDGPVLKSYLGINDLNQPIPNYWKEIQNYPQQKRLFTLAAGIFTHYENIEMFSNKFSTDNMKGMFEIGDGGKHMTNLRSALVVSGAARNLDRRKEKVPYTFELLFAEEDIGSLFKELLKERLRRIGYGTEEITKKFDSICIKLQFHKVLSLSEDKFKRWVSGQKILQSEDISRLLPTFIKYQRISTLKVNQWLDIWDNVDFNADFRKKPQPFYLIFKIDIRLLKRLSDVHRRKSKTPRIEDKSIQRGLEVKRTREISEYVNGGFPWSTLKESERLLDEYKDLKMPGLLPTAIVVNILGENEKRGNACLNNDDIIKIENMDNENPIIVIPQSAFNNKWDPNLKPIEIIDGQHRLFAFDVSQEINGIYEVPVVAFIDLARTWQAYLFYVINIKPKKINTSLGYDLYPLLRTQNWLEKAKDGLTIYRETRAQELVEAMWFYELSPWHKFINMLGINEGANITQAAFIRALSDSYLKKNKKLSGLFADIFPDKNDEELDWVRAQQAGFLILMWDKIARKAAASQNKWAKSLRLNDNKLNFDEEEDKPGINLNTEIDETFKSKGSMLSRDQGVTGISMFTNDLFYVAANYYDDYDFFSLDWHEEVDERDIKIESIDEAIDQFRNHKLNGLLDNVALEFNEL